ncbi:hypothetical protein MTO96_026315 [Rhipicephalus appendiculatus]
MVCSILVTLTGLEGLLLEKSHSWMCHICCARQSVFVQKQSDTGFPRTCRAASRNIDCTKRDFRAAAVEGSLLQTSQTAECVRSAKLNTLLSCNGKSTPDFQTPTVLRARASIVGSGTSEVRAVDMHSVTTMAAVFAMVIMAASTSYGKDCVFADLNLDGALKAVITQLSKYEEHVHVDISFVPKSFGRRMLQRNWASVTFASTDRCCPTV